MCGQFAIDAAGNWRPLPLVRAAVESCLAHATVCLFQELYLRSPHTSQAQQCASAPFFGAVGPDGKPTTSTITQIIAASRTRTPPRSPVKVRIQLACVAVMAWQACLD